MSTATLPAPTGLRSEATASDVLYRMARLVDGPHNASLSEALHTATRNPSLADQAINRLARTLGLRPRDLPLWAAGRNRKQISAALNRAAGATR